MNKIFNAKIIKNKKIASEYYTLEFSIPKNLGKILPGQFFEIKINNTNEPFLRRPFGAHKIKKASIEILYKVVGKSTATLSEKKSGEVLNVIGPLGNGFKVIKNKSGQTAILIGGGHGVAPLYALAQEFVKNKIETYIIIGGRTKEHIVSENEFKKLGVKVHVATDDGSRGIKGTVMDVLERILEIKGNKSKIYSCGPKGMLRAVSKKCGEENIECEISMEEYFGCGIGICMGCAIKTKQGRKLICKDGPVFNSKEIIWE